MLTSITTFDIKGWSCEQAYEVKGLNPEIRINPEVSHPWYLPYAP